MKHYSEPLIVAQLSKKQDIRIAGNTVEVMKAPHCKGDIGIHSKGKIDFLVRHMGYLIKFVTEFKRY